MGKVKRQSFVIGVGLALLLAGCSQGGQKEEKGNTVEASGEVVTAASTDFVEREIGGVEKKADSIEERMKNLESDIAELSNEQDSEGELVFQDVKDDYWAHKEIMNLYEKGIIKGYPLEKKFYPERNLTRYQAASMLVKALNLPLSDKSSVFKDVGDDHSGVKEIMATYESGIFTGSDGSFLPNEPMKRRHMAMVLQRALDLEVTQEPFKDYLDVDENVSGYEAIKAISQRGIANGSDGYFKPEIPTKRSHFSAFVYRALNSSK